ncbi:MAG: transglycosylase SLT domain-containing protein [Acetobacter papayae]|uniref:transglycosylase SLT domain-containing protein n=1 Tax=Acetobacter papayae TaxID=1076592 RepID=UPI0039E9EC47
MKLLWHVVFLALTVGMLYADDMSVFNSSFCSGLALLGALLAIGQKAEARSPEAMSCITAVAQAERAQHIPESFLFAMSKVESGRLEPDGVVAPWPWTITAAGVGHYYQSRQEAVAAVQTFRNQGVNSLDVGCMQINLQQHPDAFPSVDQAFDPVRNAQYGAMFLRQMYDKTGSWPRAAAAYHSQTPGVGTPYQWKVLEAWAVPQDGRELATAEHRGEKGLLAKGSPLFGSPIVPAASRTPTVLKPADGQQVASASDERPAPSRVFHPFAGLRSFSEPAVHRPATASVRGRSLASYRASPVALAGPRKLVTD